MNLFSYSLLFQPKRPFRTRTWRRQWILSLVASCGFETKRNNFNFSLSSEKGITIMFDRIVNTLLVGSVLAVLSVSAFRTPPRKLTADEQMSVNWVRNVGLAHLQQGDFLSLGGETYVVVDPNWRTRRDGCLVLQGPTPSSNEASREIRICVQNDLEAFNLYSQLQDERSQVIMQKDPQGLGRDQGWETLIVHYVLQ